MTMHGNRIIGIAILLFSCLASAGNELQSLEVLYLESRDGDLEVIVKNLKTNKTRQLTDNKLDDLSASWSPDGNFIIYLGRTLNDTQLWVYDYTTNSKRQLAKDDKMPSHPSWSPDGHSIIYVTNNDSKYQVRRIELSDGNSKTLFESDKALTHPFLSPDQKLVGFTHDQQLMVVELETGKLKEYFSGEKARVLDYSWSPDSKRMLATARINRKIDLYDVAVVDASYNRLTQSAYLDVEARMAPSGKQLLFLSSRGDGTRRQLFVGGTDTSDAKAISPESVEVMDARWSPDGQWISYVSYTDGRFHSKLFSVTNQSTTEIAPESVGFHLAPQIRPRP